MAASPPPSADRSVTETFTTPPPSGGGDAPPEAPHPASGASLLDQPPPPGAPKIPDFHVTGRLGAGGMGVVWRAVQRSTRREVALKVLSGGVLARPRDRRRFEREVELAARLEHAHIARVYAAGVHTDDGGGETPWYAMERVDGRPLDDHVKALAPAREDQLVLMEKVARAVAHAHRHGIIHRDLKPANILVDDAGRPAVLDFGLAKLLDPGSGDGDPDAPARHELSVEGQIAGTPAYMSPEQADGRTGDVDTRSDVYALGVILYRLVTGATPHDLTGGSAAVLRRIAEDPVRPPRATDGSRSGVDRELETLLGKALEHDPDRRYESAAALAEDLRRLRTGEPLLARRPTVTYLLGRRLKRHRRWVAAAGVLLASGVAGTAWAWSRPVGVPLESIPAGAQVFINGVSRASCSTTPCHPVLGPGSHLLELRKEGFEPMTRRVTVAWGNYTDVDVEESVLVPRWRLLYFVSDPPGRNGRLTRPGTGEVAYRFTTPSLERVDAGDYELSWEDGATEPEPEIVEVRPDLTTVTIRRDLPTVPDDAADREAD